MGRASRKFEDDAPVTSRRSVVVGEAIVAQNVRDGMTVAVGGFINAGHPMSLVRALIRAGVKDLTLVGAASAGLDVDLLIGAGVVRRLITPYVGAEGLAPIGPAFRAAAQLGLIDVFEIDEAMYYAGLRAAAQMLPFNPWRAGVGTSYPEVNPWLVEFTDPIKGEPLLAVPAIDIDVALLHAAVSDVYGNVRHNGHGYGDRALAAAADVTIVSVEQLVSTERIRADPLATTVAGATHVVRAPYGAHPFGSDGYYPPDREAITDYVHAAGEWQRHGDRKALDAFIDEYVLSPRDGVEYLERIGMRQLLALSEYGGAEG
jgi:glutaconate CoA-transferase subunit A